MKKRDIIFFAVALFISIIIAIVARMILSPPPPQVPQEIQEKPRYEVLVAPFDLAPGGKFDPESYEWAPWPEDGQDDDFFTPDDLEKLTKYEGAIVRYRIRKGSPVRASSLLHLGDRSIITAIIPSGKRAYLLPLEEHKASIRLSAGDLVDVIAQQESEGLISKSKGSAKTILRRVKVLAVNGEIEPNSDTKVVKFVTLELSPMQVELVAAAIASGSVSLSLHGFLSEEEEREGQKRRTSRVITVRRGSQVQTINFDTEVELDKKESK